MSKKNMLPNQFHDKHTVYLNQWMQAEEVLKLVERIKNEVFFPSINELRYAGRRIVQADHDLQAGNATHEVVDTHLIEAIQNCRKARHDAIDSAINYIHERLDNVTTGVGLAVLTQAFPKYAELRSAIRDVDKRIVASRKERSALDDEYEAIKKVHLTKVVDLYCELECSEPIINAIQKKQRKDFIMSVIVFGLVVGLATSAAMTIADKKKYFDWAIPTTPNASQSPSVIKQ